MLKFDDVSNVAKGFGHYTTKHCYVDYSDLYGTIEVLKKAVVK